MPAVIGLLLAACASTPKDSHGPSIPEPVPVSLPASESDPFLAALPDFDPAAVPTSPMYGDLLARLRTGFAIEEIDDKRIDRETDWIAKHPDYLERTLNRAAPYWHFIVNEVEARKLPLELAVLPIIESAFEPYAYSRARAAGLWQFIPGTGTRFGLKQDWWYDGRRDVVSATRAALDYLEFLAAEFDGDWLLAVAAYNCGEANVARAIKANLKAGKPTDFWNLKLPKETRAYVPKLLAMSRVLARPADFGLEFSDIPDEPYFASVETGGQIDLQVAADLAGISIEDMYALNPAYHRWATDPNGPHFLVVPVEAAHVFRQNLLQLTPDQRMRVERYNVRQGDTVASIAKQFGTSPQILRELNSMGAAGKLEIDTELRVPSAVTTLPPKVVLAAALVDRGGARAGRKGEVHVVRRGDSLWNIAKKNGMDVKTLAKLNGMSPNDTLRAGQRLKVGGTTAASRSGGLRPVSNADPLPADGRRITYVVRRGDTLSGIARVLQVSVSNLLSWNDLTARATIKPGQKLVAFVRQRS
ncbi:MAG: LysM peptidoglycan-binding domain-containing protein [Pseudomonadota bacterium]